MTVVFTENFEQDTPESIVQRYPGSVRYTFADDINNAFPLAASYLQTGTVPFGPDNNRLEIRMELIGTAPATSAAITMNLFGIQLDMLANRGGITVGSATIPSLHEVNVLNLIVDRVEGGGPQVMVADGQTILTPTLIPIVSNSWIGSNHSSVVRMSNIRPYMKNIVVAVDTSPGTYLTAPQFIQRSVSIVDVGTWNYTDVGFVEDLDKADPTEQQPNVNDEGNSTIVYEVVGATGPTRIYAGGYTHDPQRSIELNGKPVSLGDRGRALPTEVSSTIQITSMGAAGQSNGDITFLGERNDLISYADLSAELGFTVGTLIAGDTWLHYYIDGKELLVAKTPARHSVSWDHIYDHGLVYGIDHAGPYPGTNGPRNQWRTIEIGDAEYLVRLLNGADIDPTTRTTGEDMIYTRRSEWARLFYPISSASPASYTGRKLASYSNADLGLSGGSGTFSWCKEVAVQGTTLYRIFYGTNSSISYVSSASPSTVSTGYSWRPVLERIS